MLCKCGRERGSAIRRRAAVRSAERQVREQGVGMGLEQECNDGFVDRTFWREQESRTSQFHLPPDIVTLVVVAHTGWGIAHGLCVAYGYRRNIASYIKLSGEGMRPNYTFNVFILRFTFTCQCCVSSWVAPSLLTRHPLVPPQSPIAEPFFGRHGMLSAVGLLRPRRFGRC